MTSDQPDIDNVLDYAWRHGLLEWKLWPQQLPIYRGIHNLPKKTDEVVILCARQFGKSHLGVLMATEDCLRYPNRCILIMGPTLKQAREIVTPRLNNIKLDAPKGLIRPSKSESKWYIGESELVIGGFDTNSTSQRGKTVQNIYIEEVVDSNPDDYNESMRSDLGPALTHSDGGKMIFLTTPPKIPDHPFITDTMAKAELNDSLYIFTIDDNKALSQEQYDKCVARSGGRHTVDFRREYMCEIVRDASIVVVPDYDDDRHVRVFEKPRKFIPHITLDFGGVRDKTYAYLHWWNYLDAVSEIWDERVFEPNTPTKHIVDSVLEMEATHIPNMIAVRYADAPGQTQVDLTQNYGFQFSIPPKTDWEAAVNNLSVQYTLNKVRIHPRCKFLRQSLKSGTFNKHRTDFERTEALGHCDALAANMYGTRVETKTNPYSADTVSKDHVFRVKQSRTEEIEVAEALQPRVFSNTFHEGFKPKRFGTFKSS